MIYYAYPAIFFQDNDVTRVVFPDLNLTTDGKDLTEAFLFAKDLLRVYFTYVLKYDLEYNLPSKVEDLIAKCNNTEIGLIVDTFVDSKKVKKQ